MKKIIVFFVFVTAVISSCKQERKIILASNNIDSIVISKREEGQLYEYAKRFVVTDKSVLDTIYQSYFNIGKYLKDYYIKLPAGRYTLSTYRTGAKNDTVIIWHDMIRVSDVGVIQLQRNIEPYLDELFLKDSSSKVN